MALLAFLLLGSIGLQLANPQIIRFFIDATQTGGAQQTLLTAAILFIGVALLQRVVSIAGIYTGLNVGWTATNTLRAALTRHCIRLDMPFHKTRTPGELIERIDGDVTILANFFSEFVIQVLGNTLLILGILVLLFREDWRVGAALSVYALVTFVALGALQQLGSKRWAEARQASAEQFGYLEERISGTEDIRANGAEEYVIYRLYPLIRKLLEKGRMAIFMGNLTTFTTKLLYVAGYTIGLAFGAYLYMQGQVTIGTAFLFVYYIGMLAEPLENVRRQVEDLQQASASIDRVEELFAIQPEVQEQVRATLPPGMLSIEAEDLSFNYDNGDNVLRDISFRLEQGQVLGLLGRTGSGKTTLTRLLFRLYDPSAGAIRLNGIDLRDVALGDLRSHVGMVTQDVQLFHATIRDNLTFFNKRLSDERIEQVLRAAGLWDWYHTLPEGLDTMLGAGGQGLSAGEAQLLAFSRVFLKDPGLVILDEASSRLDPATERVLDQAVGKLFEGRTGIIIAHRLQTVQKADMIMILEHGRIVEYGAREELASNPGSRYYRLLRTGLEEAVA